MRKAFSEITDQLIREDERTILLLGDIGVFAFRKTIEDFPLRAMNFGIMEQTMISFASGLAKEKFIPIVHTIAPFLVERAYEQLKVDFGYQQLSGNFISVGASNDYTSLGCTHHSPGDVGSLLNIPGFEIVIPGTSEEFQAAYKSYYSNSKATYYRLTDQTNNVSFPFNKGKGVKIKDGSKGTILAIGPVLNSILPIIQQLDIELLYVNQIMPFDSEILSRNCISNKLLVIEPFYSGTSSFLIMNALRGRNISVDFLGIPRNFLTDYSSNLTQEYSTDFEKSKITARIKQLIEA
jgi:transketolase